MTFGLAYYEAGEREDIDHFHHLLSLCDYPKSMSLHIRSYDLVFTCATPRSDVRLERLCFLSERRPGKTISADSHIFIGAMVILVFARGCFGPRPCVIGTSRDPVWEFSLIMHSVVSLAYIPHIVRLVLFELCRCTMVRSRRH